MRITQKTTQTGRASCHGRRGCLGVAGLLWLFAWPPAAEAAPARPTVRLGFEIKAPAVFGALPAERRERLAARVSRKLGEVTGNTWRFADWVWGATLAERPDGEWIVRLEEEPVSITHDDGDVSTDWIIRVRHYCRRGAEPELELPQDTEGLILYDVGTPKPGQDPEKLELDLDHHLESQLTPDFLSRAAGLFVGRIPLGCTELVLDEDGQRVIVPLRRSELKASPESVFGVEFTSSQNKSGKLEMEASDVVTEGELVGCIYGPILLLRLHPVVINQPFYWNDLLLQLLASPRDLQVFMAKYVKDLADGAATSDGNLLEPDR